MDTEEQQQFVQPNTNSWMFKIKRFIIECKRVLIVTKKPGKEEFNAIFKVSGIGILLIGFLGFLVHIISQAIVG
jgi:protein transport protein SEC61 subunit gamma-like protein